MKNYVKKNGWHFNYALYRFASENMITEDEDDNIVVLEPYEKDEVDDILIRNGVHVYNKGVYDYVYVANRCRVMMLDSSISDELHLAMYVKDVCDAVDIKEGDIMKSWLGIADNGGYEIPWGFINSLTCED